jgi:hypothetical protein
VFQKELRIPAKPTDGPQPFPEDLDGYVPNFQKLNTIRYGYGYGVKQPRKHAAENQHQLRPFIIQSLSVFVFSVEEDYTPFDLGGDELLYVIDVINRTYEVKEAEHFHFDEVEYLEVDEEDRMVVIFGFEGAFKDESERT